MPTDTYVVLDGKKIRLRDNGDNSYSLAVYQPAAAGGADTVSIPDGNDVAQGASTDTAASLTIMGRLLKIVAALPASLGQKAKAASLPVVLASDQDALALAAGEAHIGSVGGLAIVSRVEKIRPADTAPYIANDTIADSTSAPTSWDFALGRVALGSGLIVAALVACDNVLNTARLEIDLYDDSITSTNDNAEATRTYAGMAKYLGTLTFPALAKPTSGSTVAQASLSGINLPYKCVSSNLIRGRVRTLDAFTPASGTKYQVTLFAVAD